MHVPFLDLKAQNRSIRSEIQAALDEVIGEAQFILGPAVERFENQFARYLGVRHCVGVNNGTSALHLALLACDIGPGDEVITTPHTWISTSWAISYVGAKPVYVDIDPVTYTLDPTLVKRAITRRTRAILPVHLYGQAADLGPLCRLAAEHGLVLLEDAAQAHGAVYAGKRVGTFGKAACFSFYPGKNLGAFGEAGAVVTDDEALAARIRRLRDHAQQARHHHVEIGYNMRMEGVQGAVLAVKLRHLDEWNAARARHARRYHELLADVSGLVLPAAPRPAAHVWHLFAVLVRGMDREAFRRALADKGVATGVHYPTPVPFQPAYAHLGHRPGDFPVAEDVMRHCVSLPMFPELTEEQVEYTAKVIRGTLAGRKAILVEGRAS
ncbi:MAG TPA: DegT/DnrJ/EryC1/StrS family aminotransferase [Gemmataceae bacterium]|nr:DegT/DnrJ/EryC1/StrS family aminotransferase [Gemmataceae bacterium]